MSERPGLKKRILDKLYNRLLKPLIESTSPVREVAWGTAIGVGVGLTPTVGIQMYFIFLLWLFAKNVFKFKFDVVSGAAMVWISNPLTMFFLYYLFYITGDFFIGVIGINWQSVSYELFKLQLQTILDDPSFNFFERVYNATKYLMYDLGIPLIIGCLFYAIPGSIISFFLVEKYLPRYRIYKSKNQKLNPLEM